MDKLVHLHTHSDRSFLDGLQSPEDIARRIKEINQPAVAVSDHGNVFAFVPFYDACVKEGIKPILGCEMYLAPDNMDIKNEETRKAYHLVLLVKNMKGYKNLVRLSTISYRQGFYYRPRIDIETLKHHHDGLVCLSACVQGPVARSILDNDMNRAIEYAQAFEKIFPKGDFYLEVQNHNLEDELRAYPVILDLADKLGLPLIATNDAHYARKEDHDTQDALLCISMKKTLADDSRISLVQPEFYLKTRDEMYTILMNLIDSTAATATRRTSGIVEALDNTLEVAEKCNLELVFNKKYWPKWNSNTSMTAEQEVHQKMWEGFYKKMPEDAGYRAQAEERLLFEYDVITRKNLCDYFLIAADIVNWAKSNRIPVGPGRGSAAGSLVSYCLGITNINPLDYGLMFERFLNPDREKMPDIDIDFCYDRRDEVIHYLQKKYGIDRVAQISTFGRMNTKQAIRDSARVLGFAADVGDRIAKGFPEDKEIKEYLESKPANLSADDIKILNLAAKLCGVFRQGGQHAAGVVICDRPLDDVVAVKFTSRSGTMIDPTIQADMYSAEKLGLLKMDILGLKTLTTIRSVMDMVGVSEMENIPLNDEKTYTKMGTGHTIGMFQLESGGMRRLVQDIKPKNIMDVATVLALYRPGPLGAKMEVSEENAKRLKVDKQADGKYYVTMVDLFVYRRNHQLPTEYLHPSLEPILHWTHGVIVYQEQIIQIAHQLAGYTKAEADTFREAVGKKKPEQLKKEKPRFIKGLKDGGIPKKIAEEIYQQIEYFAGYGFNLSHSVSYAYVAYITAYLKTNYPVQFYIARLNEAINNKDKTARYSMGARQDGIPILSADINKSSVYYTQEGTCVRKGLLSIPGTGLASIDRIIKRRGDKPFVSLEDFAYRMGASFNKRIADALIEGKAFTSLGHDTTLKAQLEEIMGEMHYHKMLEAKGQLLLV